MPKGNQTCPASVTNSEAGHAARERPGFTAIAVAFDAPPGAAARGAPPEASP